MWFEIAPDQHDCGVAKLTPKQSFAKVLRDARKKAGLTQERLAEAADVHLNYIGLLERGQRSPSLDVMLRIAKALDMRFATLSAAIESRMNRG